MKKYSRRNINGDAGEYFFAYKITSMFGFITRLLDIDIGVDGEIEIAKTEVSSGHFIKAQVKTEIVKGDNHSVYVEPENIEYWKEINIPVIVFLVDLKYERIFWRQILSESDYSTNGQSNKVYFDLTKMELTKSCKDKLISIAMPPEKNKFNSLRKNINKYSALFPESIARAMELRGENMDIEYENLSFLKQNFEELHNLIQLHPSLIKNGFLQQFNDMGRRISSIEKYLDKCSIETGGL